MAYQSIFAGSTPAAPTPAPTGTVPKGYRSIFAPSTPSKSEFKQQVTHVAQVAESQQLKKAMQQQNPADISTVPELKDALKGGAINRPAFLQRFTQLANAPGGSKTPVPAGYNPSTEPANPHSLKNIISGGSAGLREGELKVGEGLQQAARAPIELAQTLQPTNNAKATPTKGAAPSLSVKSLPVATKPTPIKATPSEFNTSNNTALTTLLGPGKTTSIQAQSKGAETSHPGGFRIPGVGTLSPKQTGAAEGALKTASDLSVFFGGGKAADAGGSLFAKTASDGSKIRPQFHQDLTAALQKGSNEPVHFGQLSDDKFNQVNDIRNKNGQAPLTNKDMHIYPAVVSKLKNQRVNIDGLTPNKVADIMNSAVNNTKSKVFAGKYPQNQVLTRVRGDVSNLAHIGEFEGAPSIKTAYQVKTNRLSSILGGRGDSPSSTDELPRKTPLSAQTPISVRQDSVKTVPDKTPSVKAPKGEEGSVDISGVQDLIAKHRASTKFSGDLEKNIDESQGKKTTIAEDVAKVLQKRTKISNEDKQTLQDYRDAKNAGLPAKALPAHLQSEDADVTALNKATQAADAERSRLNGKEAEAQKIEQRNPETYTHREAQGKGNSLDYILQESRKNPLSVSGLSKSTPGSKARVFHAITDEQGNRRVVAIKNNVLKAPDGRKIAQGKLVQAIDKGTSENLGKLKFKSDRDFLDKELSPYQTKIKNLQKEYDTLGKVKAKGGVSEARMDSLARKTALLEDARNFSGLTKGEAKSLREATLKLQELSKVKTPGTNAVGRLKTIQSHLIDLNNKVSDIHDKYDPETLDKKVFVGKDGKKYTIGQATQSEITKATGQKYYVDPKLLAAKNYADSRTALENSRFIESIKQHPDFENFASEPGKTAPKGWQKVENLPQFMDYKFDPKTAEVLRDLVKNSDSDEPKLLDRAGKFLRQTIVYFPLKHIVNEGATFAVDRGLANLVNPLTYKRGASALVKGYHDVTNMSEDFMKAQEAGLHTTTGGDKALQDVFTKQLKTLDRDSPAIVDTAKKWGTSPARLYRAIQNVTVWQLQDILNMARVNERMAPKLLSKGDSIEDAVAKTQKFNLQYKVPSRVGPRILPGVARRGLSNTLQSPKIFFGRYKYDQFRIITNIIKDTLNPKSLIKNPGQNAQALDKLAALALATAVVWPLVDKGVQKLSGDKNAYISAPGVLGPIETAQQVQQGKKAPLTAASSQLYLSSAITGGLDIAQNRDAFTGKQIYDPNSSIKQQFADISKWIGSQAAPTQQIKQGTSDKANQGINILLTLASARLPKNSPEVNAMNSLKFDSLPGVQTNAKAQAAKGNIPGAISLIKNYDSQILSQAKKALQTAGQPVPDDKTLTAKLKEQGYYYNPTLGTVKSWQSPATKSNSLDNILNASPAPKKGQPGYLQYLQQQKIKRQQDKFKSVTADKQGIIVP